MRIFPLRDTIIAAAAAAAAAVSLCLLAGCTAVGSADDVAGVTSETSAPSAAVTSAPSPIPAATPGGLEKVGVTLPKDVTVAAGADLPASLRPRLRWSFATDPAWRVDEKYTNAATEEFVFRGNDRACMLQFWSGSADWLIFGNKGDRSASIRSLKWYYLVKHFDDLRPVNLATTDGRSTVEMLTVDGIMHKKSPVKTVWRVFRKSKTMLMLRLVCDTQAEVDWVYRHQVLTGLRVEFVER